MTTLQEKAVRRMHGPNSWTGRYSLPGIHITLSCKNLVLVYALRGREVVSQHAVMCILGEVGVVDFMGIVTAYSEVDWQHACS